MDGLAVWLARWLSWLRGRLIDTFYHFMGSQTAVARRVVREGDVLGYIDGMDYFENTPL